jgi:hypothetical protein
MNIRSGIAFILSLSLLVSSLAPTYARAEPTRELFMSAAYGVLAGTLVGAATLAFTDQPGENLRNIARGASLGLYTGILLGLYVVYVIPGEGEEEESEGDYAPSQESGNFRPIISPLLSDTGKIEGAHVSAKVLSF